MNGLPFEAGVAPLTFTNGTGQEIPAFGCFAVERIEWNANGFFTCNAIGIDANTVVGSNLIAFNDGAPVADTKQGRCYLARHQPQWAAVDPHLTQDDVTESDGNYVEIGPEAGSSHLVGDGLGFLVVGGKFDGYGAIEGSRLLVIYTPRDPVKVIRGEIVDFDIGEQIATVSVEARDGYGKVWGMDSYGYVQVTDPAGCVLTLPELVGHQCWAKMMIDQYTNERYWEATGVCC